MLKYVSTKGDAPAVDFETAVLKGFAGDGGMFVPQYIPKISTGQLTSWAKLSFNELAFEILSIYIARSIICEADLKTLINKSTETFSHSDIVPVVPLDGKSNHFIMELFHGPTLSFKDIAMGFLINTMDYFLERKQERISLLLATTGDTGPAAVYAAKGKTTIDCWPLFPKGFISEEQAKQMTTIVNDNIHSIAVENCQSGGDDLDIVIADMFADSKLVEDFNLSSVNSINWCRVMFQSIHYFYGYFQVADEIGEEIAFSVPTGAFGNLFAGYLAREMGLPIQSFICANNINGTVHRVLETGVFSKEKLHKTPSNAIDIVLPYNFWRFLYFISGQDHKSLSFWMQEYLDKGAVEFSDEMMEKITKGFISVSVSNEDTLDMILQTYQGESQYLLDPHGAVAVAAVNSLVPILNKTKVISLLTAHPSKFPDVIRKALQCEGELPAAAKHDSIEEMKNKPEKVHVFKCETLREELLSEMSKLKASKCGAIK
jgi:threonine synthase